MLNGIFLGIMTFAGFWIIYKKTPKQIRRIISHPFLSWIFDIGLTVGSYILLSGISSSLSSAIGCAITGLLVSFYLDYEGKRNWMKKDLKQEK
jgi:hypothetical protein